jgi:4-methyl-5(b-hydroxyethyl)-thiazole monophosphate biosynthesis
MSKACVFFADGTEECEALIVVDLLRRAGVAVTVASASGSLDIVSSHKIRLHADALAEDVNYEEMDLVVLPGGVPGTPNLEANATVCRVVKEFFADENKKVAAICAAPSILGHMGLLAGRKATSHAKFRDQLDGAVVMDSEVVVDGNLITSFGLGGAIPFALELVRELEGEGAASRIRDAIEYLH